MASPDGSVGAPPHRSFDVFDTVLTRAVGSPDAVFDVVGRHLRTDGWSQIEPATFARIRRASGRRLAADGRREPTLVEIYRDVVAGLGAAPESAEHWSQVELACERALSRAVPGAAAAVGAAHEVGPVAFISDTPLPGAFVEELLRAARLWRDGDAVYTSADHGVTKGAGGALFQLVADDLGIAPGQLLHVGDNDLADVREARLRGLSARPAPAGRLNRYERLLEADALTSDGVSSYLAGASRLARMDATLSGTDPDIAAVAAGVATPLLVGYALWLVRQARQRGLRRLYFVSRDAEIMMRIFVRVAEASGADDLEPRYLYGSRAAWELSSLDQASAADVHDRLTGHSGDTAREAIVRIGLTVEEVRAQAPDILPPAERLDDTLSDGRLEQLAGALGAEPLLGRIRAVAAERRELMLAYLTQEGLSTDGATSGLVDVGWMGRTFQALDTGMERAGFPAVHSFFYVGRSALADRWSSPSLVARQHAWLFDHIAGTGMTDLPSGMEVAIEALCTGREGSLSGYGREGDRIVPVLVEPTNAPVLEWGLEDVRTTVDLAVGHLVGADAPLDGWGDLRGAAAGVLREMWTRPTPREVSVWGSFPMDSTDSHAAMRPLAVTVRTPDVTAQLRAGRIRLRPPFSWRAGTAAVSPAPWRQVLGAMAWYDANGARLRRAPHRLRLAVTGRRDGTRTPFRPWR